MQPPVQWAPGLFSGIKRSGPNVDHPTSNSAKVKELIELYFWSPYVPAWLVIG